MILPIYIYGQPVLKKVCEPIEELTDTHRTLIANMWETMYNARGVGLAAPQVGKPVRLFMIDTVQIEDEDDPDFKGIKRVFINAYKVEETGEEWEYEEGCLSIPDIRGDVERPETLKLRYMDESMEEREEVFTGINARVIQHEYDHIEGTLFVEHLKPLKRRRIKRRLENMKKGVLKAEYPVRVKKV